METRSVWLFRHGARGIWSLRSPRPRASWMPIRPLVSTVLTRIVAAGPECSWSWDCRGGASHPRSLSDLGPIYCAGGRRVQISPIAIRPIPGTHPYGACVQDRSWRFGIRPIPGTHPLRGLRARSLPAIWYSSHPWDSPPTGLACKIAPGDLVFVPSLGLTPTGLACKIAPGDLVFVPSLGLTPTGLACKIAPGDLVVA